MSKSDKLINVKFKEGDKINAYVGEESILLVDYVPSNWTPKDGDWDFDSEYIKGGYRDGKTFTFTPLKEGTSKVTFTPRFREDLVISCDVVISNTTVKEIKILPRFNAIGLNSNFDVNVKYVPDIGTDLPTWDYDKVNLKYDEQNSTRYKARFMSITTTPNAGNITATYNNVSDSVKYTVSNNPVSKVSMSPSVNQMYVNDIMQINLTFVPSSSDKIGVWDYNEEYFEFLSARSSPTVGYFRALKSTQFQEAQKITFTCSPIVSATCLVTINYTDVNSVSIKSSASIVKVPNGFTVEVTYDPPSAKHFGTWTYDEEYFKLENKSTEELVYFSAIKPSDKPLPLFLTAGGRESNVIEVTPDYSDLKSISFDPPEIDVKALESFLVKVIYNPSTARHTGTWDIDSYLQYVNKSNTVVESDSYSFSTLASTLDKGFTDDKIGLKFDSGYDITTLPCKIDYSDLKSFSYSPLNDTIVYGSSTKVKVNYDPPSAKHAGTWTKDNPNAVRELPDSTADVGHFIGDINTDETAYLTFVPSVPMSGSSPEPFRVTVGYSDLEYVKLSPSSGTCNVGDTFVVYMSYFPDTAQKEGALQWTFPDGYVEMVLDASDNERTTFRALKPTPPSGIKLSFIPDGVDSVDYDCVVQYDPISSVTLSPTTSSVKPGGNVSISVSYEPENAQHKGYWKYDMDKISYLQDSDATEYGNFYVLKNIDAGETIITYVYDESHTVDHVCTVELSDTKNVLLSPTRVDAPRGTDFYVDIIYEPESAQHKGIWTYDETQVKLMQDSTPNKAHFTVLENANPGPQVLKFSATPINPVQTPPVAYMMCRII